MWLKSLIISSALGEFLSGTRYSDSNSSNFEKPIYYSVTPSFNINQCNNGEFNCERTSDNCDPTSDDDCGIIAWRNVGQTLEVTMVNRFDIF